MSKQNINPTNLADLVRADVALQSFRDGGYNFTDAIGEIVDNSIQAGARNIKFDWKIEQVRKEGSDKQRREITSLAVFDDGQGIPPNILPNVLTIGFSTRYNSRDGIGRFGVGFKLATISQARRLEIYSCPAYLHAETKKDEQGQSSVTYTQKNDKRQIFKSYLDLDEITQGEQQGYVYEEVSEFPVEYKSLTQGCDNCTLIVWRKIDRMNEDRAYAESVDEKIAGLGYFLSRTYRIFIDKGLNIFLPDKSKSLFALNEPLTPYDPTFQIENPIAEKLAQGESMKGELVEDGEITIGKEVVKWRVFLTPKVTRLVSGGGGEAGPLGDKQFKKLHIPDNQGKISFLRHDREISYVKVPYLINLDPVDNKGTIDRHIGIEVLFSPGLDEYFQVKHIKRGVEPVDKLKNELRDTLNKPIKAARSRIREIWKETVEKRRTENVNEDVSGGRERSEVTAKISNPSMPLSRSGETISQEAQHEIIIQAAEDAGIKTPEAQGKFVEEVLESPIKAIELEWPGKGLLDIEHLNRSILIKINRRHPFMKNVYLPLKEATKQDVSEMDIDVLSNLLQRSVEGIDLLLFAYAKAEAVHPDPEAAYLELREDWGKFAAIYLKKHEEMDIA